MGPTRTRGGREYADEVKPSEDAAATPITLPAPIIKEGYRKVAFFLLLGEAERGAGSSSKWGQSKKVIKKSFINSFVFHHK